MFINKNCIKNLILHFGTFLIFCHFSSLGIFLVWRKWPEEGHRVGEIWPFRATEGVAVAMCFARGEELILSSRGDHPSPTLLIYVAGQSVLRTICTYLYKVHAGTSLVVIYVMWRRWVRWRLVQIRNDRWLVIKKWMKAAKSYCLGLRLRYVTTTSKGI